MAFDLAQASGRTDAVAAAVANLAGTIGLDNPGVTAALDARTNQTVAEVLANTAPGPGDRWFSERNWRSFVERIAADVQESRATAAQAVNEAASLREELARVERALRQREEALSSTRAEGVSQERESNQRVAANSLRPVARALADSYEARSLEALQDTLSSVLARARINPIGAVGELVSFNPIRHRWVGYGVATDLCRVISPGFVIGGEGADDDIVLVPARVVGPREG